MPIPMRSSDSSMSRACCLVSATLILKAPWLRRGVRLAEQIVYPIRPPDWQIVWMKSMNWLKWRLRESPEVCGGGGVRSLPDTSRQDTRGGIPSLRKTQPLLHSSVRDQTQLQACFRVE